MEHLITLLQLTMAFLVVYVWVFGYHNFVVEFKRFGLSDVVRNAVKATMTALAILLVLGIRYPSSRLGYGRIHTGRPVLSFQGRQLFTKKLPSLILLMLSASIAVATAP